MTSWQQRTAAIKVGDKIAYSKQWLQSTGQLTGDTPHARGTVQSIEPVGELHLAVIKWDTPDLPDRVNIRNLSRVQNGVIMDKD